MDGILRGEVDIEEGAFAANEQREVDIVPGPVTVGGAILSLEPSRDVRPDRGVVKDPPSLVHIGRHLLGEVLVEPGMPADRRDDLLLLLGVDVLIWQPARLAHVAALDEFHCLDRRKV